MKEKAVSLVVIAPYARRQRGTGDELRTKVIRVASEMMAELGDVDALTMRDIASAAGVTAPSVYRHFPNKHTLLRIVITERFDELSGELRAAAAAAGDEPMNRLDAIVREYVRSGLANPGHYRVLFSTTNAGPAGLGLAEGERHPGTGSLGILFEAVSACLSAADDADATFVLAIGVWTSLHGIVDLRITKPDMPWPPTDQLVDDALTRVRTAASCGPHERKPS